MNGTGNYWPQGRITLFIKMISIVKIKKMIPYGRQVINQADIDAVVAVMCSDFLTQGPFVPVFEMGMTEL